MHSSGNRAALGEVGGKPAEQRAELERMSGVATEHHDAVDRIEDEVAVGRHGVEARLGADERAVQAGDGRGQPRPQPLEARLVDGTVGAIDVERRRLPVVFGDLVPHAGRCQSVVHTRYRAAAVVDQRRPRLGRRDVGDLLQLDAQRELEQLTQPAAGADADNVRLQARAGRPRDRPRGRRDRGAAAAARGRRAPSLASAVNSAGSRNRASGNRPLPPRARATRTARRNPPAPRRCSASSAPISSRPARISRRGSSSLSHSSMAIRASRT